MKAIFVLLLTTLFMALCGFASIYLFGAYWWWDWGWPGPHTMRRWGLLIVPGSFMATCISAVNQNRPKDDKKGKIHVVK